MASTNTGSTLCDIDLNVEITLLSDLNIDVETSLTKQPIFDLEESDEDNLEEETEESNNGTCTIFISLRLFTLSLLSTNKLCLKKTNFSFSNI